MSRAARAAIACALACAALLGCGDSARAPADSGPGADGAVVADARAGTDASPDAAELPAGNAGHPDVGEVLSAGQVRAGQVTDAAQLVEGVKVLGRVGDYKLYNGKVAFIVQGARPSDGAGAYGGELLDAMRLGQPAGQGQSLLGEVLLALGARLLDPETVGVVADGSDGQEAIVRAIGKPAEIKSIAAAIGFGSDPPLKVVIDYALRPESEVLELRWRLLNHSANEVVLPLTGVGLGDGDGASFFVEGAGFDQKAAFGAYDYVGLVGRTISYGLVSSDGPLSPVLDFGFVWYFKGGALTVPPGGEGERRYQLVLADGEVEALRRAVRRLRGVAEPPTLSGRVLDPASAPVAGARVHIQQAAADPGYVTMARSDDQGRYSAALPAGRYRLTVAADGRSPSATETIEHGATPTVRDLAIGATVALECSVKDGAGQPLPAKLTFAPAVKPAALPAAFGERRYAGGATLIVYSGADGQARAGLPPGDYRVTASRGFSYEVDARDLTLAAGAAPALSFTLKRSVDTSGYFCGDYHVHGMWSGDTSDLYPLKVAAAAAEGLEIPAATDHDFVGELGPAVAAQGLQAWMRGFGGQELTTTTDGHFNIFPLQADASLPNRGALSWFELRPPQIFAAVRKRWPDAVLQVNHPRATGVGAYFIEAGLDPATGQLARPELWSTDFDAIELFNGRGWDANRDQAVKDWYALLNRGKLATATGNSDSHDVLGSGVGYPRNCLALAAAKPADVQPLALAQAIKSGRVVVCGGAFVRASVAGKTLGEVADARGGSVALQVEVQAPSWVELDTLRVIVGGEEQQLLALDATTADPTNPAVRFAQAIPLSVGADTWVAVAVSGPGTLAPVHASGQPFALTNPIYLDVDGDGLYDPPLAF